jgi:nitrogen regulatory protein P-II 1
MKKIEAIIRRQKLDAVKTALSSVGVQGTTVTEVYGSGAQTSPSISYRGVTAKQDFVPRLKVEVIVNDDDEERVIDAIFQSAHTGEVGDGRVLVLDLNSVTRIRTGESIESESNFVREERGLRRQPLPSQEAAFAGNYRGV